MCRKYKQTKAENVSIMSFKNVYFEEVRTLVILNLENNQIGGWCPGHE